MALIQVENLEKSYHKSNVINGIDFQLEAGKCVALIGANGAGKTTTLKMLSGLLKPTNGRIVFPGEKKSKDIRSLIGYLPQHPVFYEWMTAGEFLEYSGKLSGLGAGEAKKRSNELLELVGLSDAKKRKVSKYSGGMKQRLGIAQAIIHKPKLIMLDEPVSALDPFGRREVLELLEKLKQEATVLFSTHILHDAEEICERILLLHQGVIIEDGTMDHFRDKYQQSKIDIALRDISESYIQSLRKLPGVTNVTQQAKTISVFARDLEAIKGKILIMAAKESWPLYKFEISSMNLEDVFMKAVRK